MATSAKTTGSKTTSSKTTKSQKTERRTLEPIDPSANDDVHAHLMSETVGEAEAARIASGFAGENATEATEAETPAENIAHISDATLPPRVMPAPPPSAKKRKR